MTPKIVAEISFNRPEDETDTDVRIVSLFASKADVYFSFEIGKKKDDTVNLMMPLGEFMAKMGEALVQQEVEDGI